MKFQWNLPHFFFYGEIFSSIWCFTRQTCGAGFVCWVWLRVLPVVTPNELVSTSGDTQQPTVQGPSLVFLGMISGYMTRNQQQHIKIPSQKLPTSKSIFWFWLKVLSLKFFLRRTQKSIYSTLAAPRVVVIPSTVDKFRSSSY